MKAGGRWAAQILPNIAPCAVKPDISGDDLVFYLTRESMRRKSKILAVGMLAVTPFSMLGFALKFVPHYATASIAAGIAGLIGVLISLVLFQGISSADVLTISREGSTLSRRRWWRWRDYGLQYVELRVVVCRGRLYKGPVLSLVTVFESNEPLVILGADWPKHIERMNAYAQEISRLSGVPIEHAEFTLRVGGDVRLTG